MKIIKYTAFIDILGFSNFIKNKITNKIEAETFHKTINKELIECLEYLKNDTYNSQFNTAKHLQNITFDYIWISDTFVLSIESNNKSINKKDKKQLRAMQLFILTLFVSYVNFYFINNYKLSIRGAITSKFTYLKDRLLLGEGISEAHYLEDNIAIYPRVIFSSDIINDDILLLSRSTILKDCDGYFFIDYLNVFQHTPPMCGKAVRKTAIPTKEEQVELTINNHKDMIINGLINNISNAKVFSKYLWLKEYHNNYITKNNFTDNLLIE